MTTMRKIEPSLELKNLSYAQNIPKILLEVISARTALIMLGMTYIVFFCSFAFDVYSTVQNFSDGINVVGTDSCNRISVDANTMWDLGGKWGCTLRPYVVDQAVPGTWVGRIGNLTNVISVALRFNKLNITSLQLGNTYVPIADIPFDDAIVGSLNTLAVEYSLKLFACFHEDDCSRSGRDRGHTWHPVLTMTSSSVVAEMLSPELNEVHHSVCGNTFQNQEVLNHPSLYKQFN
jgi:hypothetical protein